MYNLLPYGSPCQPVFLNSASGGAHASEDPSAVRTAQAVRFAPPVGGGGSLCARPPGKRAPLRPDRGEPGEPALRPVRSRGAPGAPRRFGAAGRPLGAGISGSGPSALLYRSNRPEDVPLRRGGDPGPPPPRGAVAAGSLPSAPTHRTLHGGVFLPDVRDQLARPLISPRALHLRPA